MIAAIPTTYRDIRFRSRLEARWAAFFDGLGAEWSYEPTDLPGWIPDFRIGDALLDVKPARAYPRDVGDKLTRALQDSVGPGEQPPRCDAWILAESPIPIGSRARLVGWHCGGAELAIGLTDRGFLFLHPGRDGAWPAVGFPGWHPLFRECHERSRSGLPGLSLTPDGGEAVDRVWAQACNATQWRRA
jgi:hypothetical protein